MQIKWRIKKKCLLLSLKHKAWLVYFEKLVTSSQNDIASYYFCQYISMIEKLESTRFSRMKCVCVYIYIGTNFDFRSTKNNSVYFDLYVYLNLCNIYVGNLAWRK